MRAREREVDGTHVDLVLFLRHALAYCAHTTQRFKKRCIRSF
jgi:hypothetical protein